MQLGGDSINRSHQNVVFNLARKGAAHILSSLGFIEEPERDVIYPMYRGKSVSKIQGSRDLCQKVVEVASKIPHALAPYHLRSQCNQSNAALFRDFCHRRMGHAFSLSDMTLSDGAELISEGFNETISRPMLQATFEDFAQNNPGLIPNKMKEWISKALSSAIYNDNATDEQINEICKKIKDPTCNEVIVIGSGWDWHLTVFIFYKGHFFFCNRGAQPLLVDNIYDHSLKALFGWSAFKIGKLENVTPQLVTHLAKRMSYNENTNLSIKNVIDQLSGSLIFTGQMHAQKVGNCTYANFKAAISCLFALWNYETTNDVQNLEVISFGKAFKFATETFYKPFTRYDRQELLKDALIDLELYSDRKDLDQNDPEFHTFLQVQGLAKALYNKIVVSNETSFLYGHKVDGGLMTRLSNVFTKFIDPFFGDSNLHKYFLVNNEHFSQEVIFQRLLSLVENKISPSKIFIEKLIHHFEDVGVKTFEQRLKICNFIKTNNSINLKLNFNKLGFIEEIKSSETNAQRLEKIFQITSLGDWAFTCLSSHHEMLEIKLNEDGFFQKMAIKMPDKALDFFILLLKKEKVSVDSGLLAYFKNGEQFNASWKIISSKISEDFTRGALKLLHSLLLESPYKISTDRLNLIIDLLKSDDKKTVYLAMRILIIAANYCENFNEVDFDLKNMDVLFNLLSDGSTKMQSSALESLEAILTFENLVAKRKIKGSDIKKIAVKIMESLGKQPDYKIADRVINILLLLNSIVNLNFNGSKLNPELISGLLKYDNTMTPLKSMRLAFNLTGKSSFITENQRKHIIRSALELLQKNTPFLEDYINVLCDDQIIYKDVEESSVNSFFKTLSEYLLLPKEKSNSKTTFKIANLFFMFLINPPDLFSKPDIEEKGLFTDLGMAFYKHHDRDLALKAFQLLQRLTQFDASSIPMEFLKNTGLLLTAIREHNLSGEADWILSITRTDPEVMKYWKEQTDPQGREVYAFLE